MKIVLEFPYSEKWRSGYLVTNSENRKNILLFNSRKDRSTVSYARYLLACKLGRFLTDDEEADHKDDDKTNDSIDNLQVLSGYHNRIKISVGQNFKHGMAGYRHHKCRCDICKETWNAYTNAYKKRKKLEKSI